MGSDIAIIVACWVVAVAGVLLFRKVFLGSRAKRFGRTARELGFAFEAKAQPFKSSEVRGLEILEEDASTMVMNVAKRTMSGLDEFLFDLPCCKESIEYLTTCAAFRSSTGKLPIFEINAKSVTDRLEEAWSRHVVHVEGDEEFSRHFCVHCEQKNQTRAFLTPARLAHIRLYGDHFRIASSPDWILIYRPGAKVDPEDLGLFAVATSTLATGLLPEQPLQMPATA